ncbi:S8 family serine peptidase [bacterium]|nr:S8 family serine peptidase [bacterium]
MAQDPRVHYVTSISPPLEMLNAGVRAAMHVNEINEAPYFLDGAGETVCVYDGGLVYPHADFEDRMTQGEGGVAAQHSTHVAGTVGGNGDYAHRGMAPAVSLLSFAYEECDPYCFYDSPQDIYENYETAHSMGARLFTNSVGANVGPNGYDCDWLGDYESVSALIDSLVRGAVGDPLIVTWAAGNERGAGCPGSYETMSVPSSAKNTIVVGATNDNDGMTTFSSWGPTDDGRIKPDVCAPGFGVSSCDLGGGYTTMSGTSMSTPAVAGVNALLMQAWHQRINPDTFPLPETVKAILCNSAEDLGTPGPDYTYGFGRVDAQRAADTVMRFGTFEGIVSDDEQVTHTFTVPEGLDELHVTLAWSDVPGGYLPEFALVNDLDLTLVDPSSNVRYPYILDPSDPTFPATPGTNTIDNVEKIKVNSPAAGEWMLVVNGTDVPVGPQTFGVAANVTLQEGVVSVSGTVMDQDTQLGIPDVLLRLDGFLGTASTLTAADGSFELVAVLNGDTRLSLSRGGYHPLQVWVVDDGTGYIDLSLEMQPGVTGTVDGIVEGSTGTPIPGADVYIAEYPELMATTDTNGMFMLTGVPALELLTVVMDYQGNYFDYASVYLEIGGSASVVLILDPEAEANVIGPDDFGYVAVQTGMNHPAAPDYDWIGIDPQEGGSGTPVNFPEEETAVLVDLPFDFPYYDGVYDQITVNENGFFCFGDVTDDDDPADYSNSSLPGIDGPPATVAPFWDDMYAPETNFSHYYDSDNGLFIAEWYDTRQFLPNTAYETFQVILYDPVFHQHGAWGQFKFQYAQVTDPSECSVGFEDETETIGITILQDAVYHEDALTITEESAILFYRPSVILEGHVELDPPNAGLEVTVTIGNQMMTAMGDFTFDQGIPGYSLITYSLDGYEYHQTAVELPENGTVTLDDVVLSRLDTPLEVHYQELNGNFDNGANLFWNAPIFGGEIDEFLGAYRVYKDGLMVTQTEELEYADEIPWVEGTRYWVTAMYAGGESDSSLHASYLSGLSERSLALPTEFEVAPPWPNPFNPSTAISIGLPEPAELDVAVYDLLGREVARLSNRQPRQAGYHRLVWDASGHASGVYFIRVNAGPHEAVKKVMLLK